MFFYNESDGNEQILGGGGSGPAFSSWNYLQDIYASDPGVGDAFGEEQSMALSADGSVLVVGAKWEDPSGINNAGSAYVYEKNGSTWVFVQKLTASDKASSDSFGTVTAISRDGAVIAVSAPSEDPSNIADAGSVYIYKKSGSTWSQVQKISATVKASYDKFGSALSLNLDGSVLVVGSWGHSNWKGAAYVFQNSSGGSTWTQSQKLVDPDQSKSTEFGNTVEVSDDGNLVVVGCHLGSTENTNNCGTVHLFEKQASTWTHIQKLASSNEQSNGYFGQSISLKSDASTIVIGAASENTGGRTYIFEKQGSSWVETQYLEIDTSIYRYFGGSVSIATEADVIVIGAKNDFSDTRGAIYVFQKSSGMWTQTQLLTLQTPGAVDQFGADTCVTKDGTYIFGSVPNEDISGANNVGAAVVFQGS